MQALKWKIDTEPFTTESYLATSDQKHGPRFSVLRSRHSESDPWSGYYLRWTDSFDRDEVIKDAKQNTKYFESLAEVKEFLDALYAQFATVDTLLSANT